MKLFKGGNRNQQNRIGKKRSSKTKQTKTLIQNCLEFFLKKYIENRPN